MALSEASSSASSERNGFILKQFVGPALVALFFLALPSVSFALPTYSCVLYLREVRGIEVYGDAINLQPNLPSENLDVGDVLVLRYGKVGHVAEIIGYEGEQKLTVNGRTVLVPETLTILEANFKAGQVTVRTLAWDDTHIKGVYRPKA